MPPAQDATRKILPGMGNTKGVMTPLIPFNIIVDTDFGLLNLIRKEYADDDVFDLSYFKNKTIRELTKDLYERKVKNPLSLIIREDYWDMMDEFYLQFMERDYSRIIPNSVFTEYYRVIGSFNSTDEISTTILCDRKEEMNLCLNYENTKECNIIMKDRMTPSDMVSHNQFYFKYTEDAVPFIDVLKSKTIYIANYGFNRDDETHSLQNDEITAIMIAQRNMVRLADIYSPAKLLREDEE